MPTPSKSPTHEPGSAPTRTDPGRAAGPAAKAAVREAGAILFLTIVGAGLRLAAMTRLGLTHFDEGIYAMAGGWIMSPHIVEDMRSLAPYAPPGFPFLVGMAYLVFGVADVSAIAVSQCAGIASIPVAGWLGRRTFGPGAGAAAAALAAISGPHVAFSRMALTDTCFLLAWLIAIGLGTRFLERPTIGRAVAFGVAVGLAQDFKYNGWLAGVVIVAALLVELIHPGAEDRRTAWKALRLGLVAAAVAALVYAPWALFVEWNEPGGYSGLMRHHRSYLSGPTAWLAHWKLQMAQAVALSGGREWGTAAWCAAWIGAAFAANGPRLLAPRSPLGVGFVLGLAAGATLLTWLANLPWWIALGLTPWMLLAARPAGRVVAAWWWVLAILTPFYHPYARLWLPMVAADWLVLAGVIQAFVVARDPAPGAIAVGAPSHFRRRARLAAIGLVALASAFVAVWFEFGSSPPARVVPGLLQPTDGLQRVMTVINSRLPSEVHGLRILGRPSILYYQALVGKDKVAPLREPDAASLMRDGDPDVWAIVDEVQLRNEDQPNRVRNRLLRHWTRITAFPEEMSLPALLDVDPSAAYGESPTEQTWIWLLRPRRAGDP
jgi:4-amino-4-deoxy-L-arabinose transferase-like glycosyltransferase